MNLKTITTLLQPELDKTKQLIIANCNSNTNLIKKISSHLLTTNGKLIRPILTILCAHMCNYKGKAHIDIAAAIELIHTASLLHDDVIDKATLRRKQISTNYKWGDDYAILMGDFLLAKASHIIASLDNIKLLLPITKATSIAAEGEILQLINKNNIKLTETTYLEILTCKTAKLFEIAALLPAILSKCTTTVKNSITTYGLYMGIAFQLIDDALDITTTLKNNGFSKNFGHDLTEGKLTLPTIYLLANGSKQEKTLIKQAIYTKDPSLLQAAHSTIASSSAIAYTINLATQKAAFAKQALKNIVTSIYKDAAIDLADFILMRNH